MTIEILTDHLYNNNISLLGGIGHALLCLRPEELGFLRYLKQAKVPLNEFEFSWSKISNIQPQVHVQISLRSDFV
jgi:hypothetical protein